MNEDQQPEKLCSKCGRVIPADGYEMDGKGKVKLDDKGHVIYHKRALLACLFCAQAAMPKKKRVRMKPGQAAEEQASFNVPNISID